MPSLNSISVEKLWRLVGRPDCPILIDLRTDEDFSADPRLIPGAQRRSHLNVADWAFEFAGKSTIIYCQKGLKLSQGVAAWLRHNGAESEALEGGYNEWLAAKFPLVPLAKFQNGDGPSLWVTRARPKVDRIACPWLIRRFVDPSAVFLFVNPSDVEGVADRFGATAFDVEGVYWSHRGDLCTFDVMVEEFGLSFNALDRLARIVRGADTARMDLEPEAAGLLALSLGLSLMHSDDLRQLEAGMLLYDALFRWCRDATEETHNWPSAKSAK